MLCPVPELSVEDELELDGQRREWPGLGPGLSPACVWEAAGAWRELYFNGCQAEAASRLKKVWQDLKVPSVTTLRSEPCTADTGEQWSENHQL